MLENGKTMPSIDAWLREAKADSSAPACGMYLTHNCVVRATPKAEVRGVETDGVAPGHKVGGMVFGFDAEKVQAAIEATRTMPGIGYVRVWLASGELTVGDDIMLVLIGGDIRPHVVDALQSDTIDMAQSAAYYFTGKDPVFAFSCAVPFGLTARQMDSWMEHGGGRKLMDAWGGFAARGSVSERFIE